MKYADDLLDGKHVEVLVTPKGSPPPITASTSPLTGLITERGICEANEKSILGLFPEAGMIAPAL